MFAAGLVKGDEDENPGRLLYKAGLGLMEFPLDQDEEAQGGSPRLSGYEVQQPDHGDLAISRLQDRAVAAIDQAWQGVRDPQRLRILEIRPGGAKAEILRGLELGLGRQVRDLSAKNEASGTWRDLGSLLVRVEGGQVWRETLSTLSRISRKVDALYSHLDSYLSNPESAASGSVLEDFARSIVEPGSSQEMSLAHSLVQLHNLTMPGLGLLSQEDGRLLGGRQRNNRDAFYQLSRILQVKRWWQVGVRGRERDNIRFVMYEHVTSR